MNFEINADLKRLIPPLTREEFSQLEENLLKDGIRDDLVLGEYLDSDELITVLIDGHNRLEIADKNGLEYETTVIKFESFLDVKEWMINHQFGRRNLNNYQRSTLALELEGVFSERAKENLSKAGSSFSPKEGRHNCDKVIDTIDTKKELGKLANVSHNTIARVKKLQEKATPELKEQLEKGEVSINQAYKEVKKVEIEEKRAIIRETLDEQEMAIGDKKYRIIYADPPWKYGNKMPEYVTEPSDYYLLMDTEDICNMPIKEITKDNAVLFLWSTSPHLPEALEVVKSWGFKYKTTFIWDKIKHNMGHYNSVRHEILIVATKGACTPDVKKLFDSVVSIERTEHSKKPTEFYEIIETIYTYGNKIELFCREAREGWDVFGNQIEKNEV